MKVLIVNQAEVRQLLPMALCINIMAGALEALARGETILPLRATTWLPGKAGALVMMPAYLGNVDATGLKVITYFAGNKGTDLDTHQGAVLLFDTHCGSLRAIIDATEVTAIRTAAVTAVATRLLARQDSGDLAILGAGTQARAHLEAMLLVRPVRRVRVWSLPVEQAHRFAERESARHGVPVAVAASPKEAVEGAGLICTTTSALEPVLQGDWIAPGAHINAIGSSIPFARELDTAAVVRSKLFVDRRESTLNEAGDFLFPLKEGAVGEDHIRGEVGEVLIGRIEGRVSDQEITLFESVGLAIEDVAAAHHIYTAALEQRLGTAIELGGGRHEAA